METHQHGPLQIAVSVDPMFGENTLLLWSDGSEECWIVDPGFPPNVEDLASLVKRRQNGLRPAAIVLTHGHGDHIAGVPKVLELFPHVPVYAPRDDAFMLSDAEANLSAPFGVNLVLDPPDRTVAPEDVLKLGTLEFRALDVAGHSPGGLAFYCEAAGVAITGDALFAGSIGRTDFPGSDLDRLLGNITRNLLSLPDETIIYPGHGPASTIGRERAENPFLQQSL